MEHLRHFKLNEDPFRNEPQLRLFFETDPQRDALQRLDRSVRQSRGLSVLVGDVGVGKTLVVRRLLEGLEEEMFEVSMMVVLPGCGDALSILARFARQLGVEAPSGDREALISAIYEHLAIVREEGRHAVLIVDDAEELAAARSLAEICGLLKLEYEDRRLLSLVLAGGPLLEAAIAREPLIAHHVDVKVALSPLDEESARRYLAHRIEGAGGDPAILSPDAVEALHELGRGTPGRMNTLADNALFEAFLCGRKKLARKDVERAHRDLLWSAPGPARRGDGRDRAEITQPFADADAEQVETELEAIFEDAAEPPPKDEDAEEDFVVELVDD